MSAGNIDYNAVLADLEARKTQIESAIAAVTSILASTGGGVANGFSEGVIRPENIPAHAFLGLSIADATKKFLGMVKSKQSLPQIMQALERGGLPPAKYNTVYAVLRRRENQVEDIFRMGEDWALTEWYPNNPNIRKRPEKASPSKGKGKGKKKSTKSKKKAAGSTATPATPATPTVSILDATEKILSEATGPLHAKAIAETLNANHGKNTTAKSVAGTLTQDPKKRFKNIGENTWELAEK